MKKLNDFKNQSIENLENIQGGSTRKGEFVHTHIVMFNLTSRDVYYDKNGNGMCDDNETSSLSLVVARG